MIFGALLLNLTILGVFGVLVYFIRPVIYASPRRLPRLQAGLIVAYFALRASSPRTASRRRRCRSPS